MHKENEKDFKFIMVQGGSPAVLGMPDIDNLGELTINSETITQPSGIRQEHRQQQEKLPMQKSNSNRSQAI